MKMEVHSVMAKNLLIIVGMLTLTIFLVNLTYGQSLADIAKKEKERRANIKTHGKVITNETVKEHLEDKGNVPGTLSQSTEESAEETPSEEAPTQTSSETKTATKETTPSEPTDLEGNNEAYWRNRIKDAQQKIADLEKQVNDLQLRLNGLQMSFYAMDDPNQRQLLNSEIDSTFEMLAKAKEDLEKAKQDLEDTREEGRKKGALPGWIY